MKALHDRLAKEGVVCSYDRAGFGWSEIGMCAWCSVIQRVAVCCSLLQCVRTIVRALGGVRLVCVRGAV